MLNIFKRKIQLVFLHNFIIKLLYKYLHVKIIITKLIIILSIQYMFSQEVIKFDSSEKIEKWSIVNDNVMGGVSTSKFYYDGNHAIFEGKISLKNNGGFASIRSDIKRILVSPKKKINLSLKGDGKVYQVRVKRNKFDNFSYVQNFKTNGKNEIISIELNKFYPSFRGIKLNKENFNYNQIEQISILIGNKQEEEFKLKIEKIFFNE